MDLTTGQSVISLIYRYARDHFLSSITTSEAARHFGYSREYFSRLFKKYSGTSFMDYVNELRLKVACERLRMPDADIGQVGRVAGFPNERGFQAASSVNLVSRPGSGVTSSSRTTAMTIDRPVRRRAGERNRCERLPTGGSVTKRHAIGHTLSLIGHSPPMPCRRIASIIEPGS